MNRGAKFAMGAAAAIVVALAAVLALNHSGLCFSQARHLAEQEIIEIGARDHYRKYPPASYGTFEKVVRPIAYASFGDFMSRNPDCCSVASTGRDDSVPSLLNRLMGRFAGFVRIEYNLEVGTPGVPGKNLVWVAVTNCGVPWNGVYWGH